MMLLDHFHPPVSTRKGWKGVHSQWAGAIVQRLNEVVLPRGFESEPEVHAGTQVVIDVGTFDADAQPTLFSPNGTDGGVAVALQTYAPPAPPITGVVSFAEPDLFEVRVYKDEGGMKLVAAIELVSEANKDRPSHRRTFATKCASYLQTGVSVVVIDVVTSRTANLHAELVDLLHLPVTFEWDSPTGLSVVCYRTVQGTTKPGLAIGNGQVRLDVWPHALAVGAELLTVPLWLAADLAVPLELEPTYAAACKSLRLA
ncbi:MAG TPA: hypothetical protein VM597_16425 [Gemmataceae bacterium]|nr:hypothetical protein [Gemmataceae bacterium]